VALLVVHCGICGFDPGIQVEVADGTSADDLRAAVASRIGESLRCERCNSELVAESGSFTVDEPPRMELARKAETMRAKINGVRFAVGTPDGPRGSVWRVWTYRSDVYIAARSAASDQKVSLHASGVWRSAFTEAHAQKENSLVGEGDDRVLDRWNRPAEFAPGWTRAFMVVVPAREVVPCDVPAKSDEIVWIEPLPDGWATIFTVLFAAPGASGSDGRGFATAEGREHHTEIVATLPLENGETVWVLAHAEEMTEAMDADVERVRAFVMEKAAAAMAKADADPDPHDFRAFGSGYGDDEVRFILDVALPKPVGTRE